MLLNPVLLAVLAAVVLGSLVKALLSWRRKMSLIDQIGGPPTLPLLGNLLDLLVPPEDLVNVVRGYCSGSRSMTRVWLTSFLPYVLLHRASSVEAVLSSSKVITKSKDYNFLLPWLGRGLLTSTGSQWSTRRKLLTPAFHFKILEDFMDVFNDKSSVLADQLAARAGGQPVDIFHTVTLCTLDIILETAMGLNLDVQKQSDTPYVRAVQRLTTLIQDRQKKPWLHADWLYYLIGAGKEHDACVRTLHELSLSTIRTRRANYQPQREQEQQEEQLVAGRKKCLPFLDLLLQYSAAGAGLTDEDIREEVDTFMFEGHDTTATAINMTLYLLGAHPQIQERVHAELDQVLTGPEISSSQLTELKLLECCVKEALRLYPSVPIMGRVAQEDLTIDGKTVPAGTQVLLFTLELHRDPDQFPDPDTFDPDRFLPGCASRRHAFAYVPFSAGPRNCIGQKFALMEEKVVLATVLRRFRFQSMDTVEDLQLTGEIILRPKSGVRVKLWERVPRQG